MGSFIRRIKVSGEAVNFYFTPVFLKNAIRYNVTLIADNPIQFEMIHKDGRWRIIDAPKVPQDIHDVERELEMAILQNSQ